MILTRLMGGLGNQMFQYAFGRYLAIKNNTPQKLDLTLLEDNRGNGIKRDYALNIFNINASFATPTEIKNFNGVPNGTFIERALYKTRRVLGTHNLIVQNGNAFQAKFLSIKPNTCVVGRWQSYKYFEEVEDVINQDFKFKNTLPGDLESIVRAIKSTESVSVHIRRTDYISNALYSQTIGALPLEYYIEAVNIISSKTENPSFYIFSDDVEWCKLNLQFIPEPITYVDTSKFANSTELDLHLMSLCKHHVISNSTFAWWGAWLNKTNRGVVIAPAKWANSPDCDAVDIIPEDWIKIQAVN